MIEEDKVIELFGFEFHKYDTGIWMKNKDGEGMFLENDRHIKEVEKVLKDWFEEVF